MMEIIKQLFETKKIEFTLFLFGITLIGIGVFVWKAGVKPTSIEIVNQTIEQSPMPNKKIFVDVSGEVQKPGVIGLVLGARVGEAIASAGGITEYADTDWVAKNLNQAKILTDGEKIYIPSIKSQIPITKIQTNSNDQYTSYKININIASESELDKLPGIGPVTAGKIINGRPYGQIDELVNRKIVTSKVWEQIKDQISAW